jgi:cytochrome c peroxidase
MTVLKSTFLTAALLAAFTAPSVADISNFVPLPHSVPEPKDNLSSPEKISLGKQLFFDARLSIDGTVSCNSCHDVQGNGTDSRATSVGVKGHIGGRSAPSVWNAAFLSAQMWDGRLATLEDQAKGPILNPIEMAMPHPDAAVKRIASVPGYAKQFAAVFGGDKPVTYDNIAKAIAAYERTLITPNSRFDQYLRGNTVALTRQEVNGMETFISLGCVRCHRGPNMAGPVMPNGEIFLQWFPAFPNPYIDEFKLIDDLGYNEGKEDQLKVRRGKWRVPSLRNIANTAPYFHNGSVKTLNKAVRVMARSQLNRELTNYEADVLEAFLKTLTGEYSIQATPMLPPDVNKVAAK